MGNQITTDMEVKSGTKPRRILVIEDEADVSKLISFILRKEGYQVVVADDGADGLYEARTHIPDLIILDLMLPSLQGEEICKALREDDREEIQGIPIIMLTAKAEEVDRIIGKVIGANSYMVKPFEVKDLLAEVKRIVK